MKNEEPILILDEEMRLSLEENINLWEKSDNFEGKRLVWIGEKLLDGETIYPRRIEKPIYRTANPIGDILEWADAFHEIRTQYCR